MPNLYLSPSTQEYNPYVTGGSEEAWMNALADAMEPSLFASGISYTRNTPDMTAASSIQASNAGSYDLHLALHSNASGQGQEGQNRGILAFYYPGSSQGQRAAALIADGLKTLYPLPNQVRAVPTTTLGEVRRVRAPAVLLELGFHDNAQDAAWVTSNIPAIADNLVLSLTEFFGIPFFRESIPLPAVVPPWSGGIAVYERPDPTSPVSAQLYPGAQVSVLNQYQNEYDRWSLIQVGSLYGYVPTGLLQLTEG